MVFEWFFDGFLGFFWWFLVVFEWFFDGFLSGFLVVFEWFFIFFLAVFVGFGLFLVVSGDFFE